jgi:hypothetical protein
MTAAYGRADQKGAVMGTLRSLGALARAIGPLTSSLGISYILSYLFIYNPHFICSILRFWSSTMLLDRRLRADSSAGNAAKITSLVSKNKITAYIPSTIAFLP